MMNFENLSDSDKKVIMKSVNKLYSVYDKIIDSLKGTTVLENFIVDTLNTMEFYYDVNASDKRHLLSVNCTDPEEYKKVINHLIANPSNVITNIFLDYVDHIDELNDSILVPDARGISSKGLAPVSQAAAGHFFSDLADSIAASSNKNKLKALHSKQRSILTDLLTRAGIISDHSSSAADLFSAFYYDVLSKWNIPYIPARFVYSTYYNYAVAQGFKSDEITNDRSLYKQLVRLGWDKKHGRVPNAYAHPDLYLSSDNDETPYQTDMKLTDYRNAYASVVNEISKYEKLAGRLALSSDFDSVSDPAKWPSCLADLPATTLLINPKAKANYDQYIEQREKYESKYEELLIDHYNTLPNDSQTIALDKLHSSIASMLHDIKHYLA